MSLFILAIVPWILVLLTVGYFLPFIKNKVAARFLAWLLILLTTILSIVLTYYAPELIRMLVIVSMQLIAMKLIVMVESYTGKPGLNFFQWPCFAGGWFGMRPALFETLPSKPRDKVDYFIITGLSRIVVGFGLLFISKYIQRNYSSLYFLHVICMLVGMSFILHFGILNLSTAAWRVLGIDVRELFKAPYKSKSLREFWGKRWNMAFSEMTALSVYKPLKTKTGVTVATLASFLLSGLLHEIAISFPVRSGFGLPFLYFVIHGSLMFAEGKIGFVKKITEHKVLSHIWVFFWLMAPITLLFHTQFVLKVIEPLRNILLSVFF
jgi:alginate O-acetyltransferase complex protein AlgI